MLGDVPLNWVFPHGQGSLHGPAQIIPQQTFAANNGCFRCLAGREKSAVITSEQRIAVPHGCPSPFRQGQEKNFASHGSASGTEPLRLHVSILIVANLGADSNEFFRDPV